MNLVNVLISVEPHPRMVDKLRRLLSPVADVEIIPQMSQPETVAREKLRGMRILFCEYPPANIEELDELKWVKLLSVDYSELCGPGLTERGIRLNNVPGVYDTPIAEWCMAMIVNLARDVPGMFRNKQQRLWDRDARFLE